MDRNERIYRIWSGMKQRCNNPNHPSARWYYEKGIRLCPSWQNDFFEFQKWALANGYFEEGSIDRIDSNIGYCPENCRWITLDENRRRALAGKKSICRKESKKEIFSNERIEVRIMNLLERIANEKGENYAAGIVEGINLMTPRVPTREETTAKLSFYIQSLDDSQLRLLVAFAKGLNSKAE